ncbi:MAG: GntR family transcriptional regulator [Muribaculaceae bacterium]|nr:GntR family transcriptional regulator [Muribaculaceae bacterium]
MKIGEYNELSINRMVDFGAYLIDDDTHEVLLPKRYLTPEMKVGDTIRVFVYNDSENRPVATTEQPYAVVGDFALMRVKAVNKVGAFLDWGLVAKDLLVPFSEQRVDMKVGRSYIVRVYLDEASHRIVASAKLAKFLNHTEPDYYHRERVEVLVVQRSDMGYRVIVEGAHWGQIYQNETYQDVNVGDRLTAFVKQVRPDGKVDLTLSKIEKMRVDDLSDRILDYLKANNGEMTLTDKASPDDINKVFQCSKKDFKKALGLLYKQQKVTLGDTVKLL